MKIIIKLLPAFAVAIGMCASPAQAQPDIKNLELSAIHTTSVPFSKAMPFVHKGDQMSNMHMGYKFQCAVSADFFNQKTRQTFTVTFAGVEKELKRAVVKNESGAIIWYSGVLHQMEKAKFQAEKR